jgi:hypothetical protein
MIQDVQRVQRELTLLEARGLEFGAEVRLSAAGWRRNRRSRGGLVPQIPASFGNSGVYEPQGGAP